MRRGDYWKLNGECGGAHVVQVGELDLHGGGHQLGVGFDDHRHHFGVEDGGVTAGHKTAKVVLMVFFCKEQK